MGAMPSLEFIVEAAQIFRCQSVLDNDDATGRVGVPPSRVGCKGDRQWASALTMLSVIFLASPRTMTVLSR